MIYTKTKPAGIDIGIQALQNFLYVQLQKVWGMAAADYTSYCRVYKNQTELDQGYSPEVYLGNNEYTDTFYDDSVKVLSFFQMGDSEKFAGGLSATVSVIFHVNLAAVKPGLAWRGDEEVRRDVEILCKENRWGLMMQSVEIGIDNVFREYSGWKKKEGIKFRDMHPFHCFRINFNTDPYQISIC